MNIKDNSKRAQRAMVGIIVGILIVVLVMVFNFIGIEITWLIWLNSIVGLFKAIVFIQWFRRAYFNSHQLGVGNCRYGEGMAAGAWFIPFAFWIIPWQIMLDLWNNAILNSGLSTEEREKLASAKGKINLWGIIYLLQGLIVLGSVVSVNMMHYTSRDDLLTFNGLFNLDIINVVTNSLNIIAGLTLIYLIKTYKEIGPKLVEASNFDDFGEKENDVNWELSEE
jgi:hypothetical protein